MHDPSEDANAIDVFDAAYPGVLGSNNERQKALRYQALKQC
jgi:hypothetical protein